MKSTPARCAKIFWRSAAPKLKNSVKPKSATTGSGSFRRSQHCNRQRRHRAMTDLLARPGGLWSATLPGRFFLRGQGGMNFLGVPLGPEPRLGLSVLNVKFS